MRSRRSLVGLALVVVTAIAASPAVPALGASPSPEASAVPTSVPSVGPAASPVAAPEMRLLDAGRKPRAVLRYTFTPGMTETMVMEMAQTITSTAGDLEQSSALPTIRYALTMTVLEVDPGGDATIEMTVASVETVPDPDAAGPVDQATVDALDAALAPMIGLRFTTRMDRRGASQPAATDLDDLDPALAQQLQRVLDHSGQLSTVLPEQAVGVGARWVSTGTASTSGISFVSRQSFTLRSIEGDTLEMDVKGTQRGEPGPIAIADMPAGSSAELISLLGTLEGRTTIDLTRLGPRSTATGSVTIRFTLSDGTTEQTLDSRADTRLVVDRAE